MVKLMSKRKGFSLKRIFRVFKLKILRLRFTTLSMTVIFDFVIIVLK